MATVCEEAGCPNRFECFSRRRLAFMVLGSVCTRACAFCGVSRGTPAPVDPDEPDRLARAVAALGLRHIVVTSVTRDDLSDGGADHFRRVVRALTALDPPVVIEILVPDFQGNPDAIRAIATAGADIINHNLETVPRLYPRIRPQADYQRSLAFLTLVKETNPSVFTKSGLMAGMGEREAEMSEVLRDLRRAGCEMITIGQYLPPSRDHLPVVEYVPPAVFAVYERQAREIGILSASCGPFVRSSYGAEENYRLLESRATRVTRQALHTDFQEPDSAEGDLY
jgi:lipoic acid synthetase